MNAATVAITGNTYAVKDQLKSLGARWNPEAKAWMVSADKAERARQIVAGAGRAPQRTASYSPRRCIACGVEACKDSRGYAVVRIYRSGECQDCYEERKMGY